MKIDWQIIHKLVQLVWGGSLIKLGSAIALIGAAALTSIVQYVVMAIAENYGQKLDIPETPVWIGLPLVIIGVGAATLGAYWQRPLPPPGPNPQDVELLRRLRSEFTEPRKDFLRDHNFHGSFPSAALDCVTEVAYWRGARFEFTDPEVERFFAVVKANAQQLDNLVSLATWPVRRVQNRQTALPDNYDEWHPDANTTQAISALNRLARELVGAIDEFERTAKVKIPITG
jgi:hypothetical protein